MYQQTCTVEKPYTRAEIAEIKALFKELEKARHSKSVQAYLKKVKAEIKA